MSLQGQWVIKGGGASCLEIYPKGGGDWLENRPIRGGVVFRHLLLVLSIF